MEYVHFGDSGLQVSRMALGLGLRDQHDEQGAERLIHRAVDRGITLFDCANVYGLGDDRAFIGKSEEILGRALKGKRDDVVITSKVASPIGSGPNDRGASRYHIMREVERSLVRLDTDRIDVYLLHVYDAATPLDEQFRALDDLVRQGKVRYVGVCNYQAWQICLALGVQERINASRLITAQNPYSLLNRELERELFPFARFTGVGIMAYAPLAIGLLSGAYRPDAPPSASTLWARKGPEGLAAALNGRPGDVIRTAFAVAERTGATVAQVALQWVMTHPEISVVITGADSAEQLDDNVGSVGLRLSGEDVDALNRVSEGMSLVGW
ncbi:MAG: 1-deoxyxylulose-5-phosphate synthase [Thermomicrobiales bacterium]|nr:1-deoxyxylulose-5-phosphate synthase [Thermomicrobiales bacterium]